MVISPASAAYIFLFFFISSSTVSMATVYDPVVSLSPPLKTLDDSPPASPPAPPVLPSFHYLSPMDEPPPSDSETEYVLPPFHHLAPMSSDDRSFNCCECECECGFPWHAKAVILLIVLVFLLVLVLIVLATRGSMWVVGASCLTRGQLACNTQRESTSSSSGTQGGRKGRQMNSALLKPREGPTNSMYLQSEPYIGGGVAPQTFPISYSLDRWRLPWAKAGTYMASGHGGSDESSTGPHRSRELRERGGSDSTSVGMELVGSPTC